MTSPERQSPDVLFEGGDVTALEDALTRAYSKVSLTADRADAGWARIERRWYGPVTVDDLDINFDVSFEAAPLDRMGLARLHSGSMSGDSAGNRYGVLHPGDLALFCQPELPFSGRASGARYDLTMFDTEWLNRVAGRRAEPVRLVGNRPVSVAAERHLTTTIDYVRSLAHAGMPPNPLVATTTTGLLAAAVLSAFPNSLTAATAEPQERTDDRPALLRRAIEFLEDHADSPVVLSDVAAAVHVTPRALQYMFRRHLQMTPMAYLRRVRLDRAHRELLAADPSATTVQHVAARWGFAHTGRFAAAYRRAYGRSPSDTLRL